MYLIRSSLFLLSALIPALMANANDLTVTVEAGEFDRRQTTVSFQLSPGISSPRLCDTQGKFLPLQMDSEHRVSFVLPDLGKGKKAVFRLVEASSTEVPVNTVAVVKEDKKYSFRSSEHALLDYQAEPGALPRENIKALFQRGAYLHPIRTLAGKVVTDDFPPNHIHHHGVWGAWTKTEFDGGSPDFWNMGDGKGRVDFVGVDKTWSGPVHAGLIARHQFVDLTALKPKVALKETWELRVYSELAGQPFWIFDLTSVQECATTNALKLPEYRYGGIGFRGHRAWNGKDKTDFLTSEGETDRLKGNAARGRWCDLGGTLEGQRVGLAILGHPENFRAPQPMRLHPTEPFFNFAPQQMGDMEIAPGKPSVSRYRFIVHDGAPDKKTLDRLWNDYAHPPRVSVGE